MHRCECNEQRGREREITKRDEWRGAECRKRERKRGRELGGTNVVKKWDGKRWKRRKECMRVCVKEWKGLEKEINEGRRHTGSPVSFRGTLGNLSFFLTHILDSVYESSIVRYIAWKPLIDRKWFLGTYNDRQSLCRNWADISPFRIDGPVFHFVTAKEESVVVSRRR